MIHFIVWEIVLLIRHCALCTVHCASTVPTAAAVREGWGRARRAPFSDKNVGRKKICLARRIIGLDLPNGRGGGGEGRAGQWQL